MARYIARRLLYLPGMLFATSVIIFVLTRLCAGDPALDYLRLSGIPPTPDMVATTREMLGLNRPLASQYSDWLGHALYGDFGLSYATARPIAADLLTFLPATLWLAGCALAMTLSISLPLGIWAARYRNRLPDNLVRVIAFLGVSMPGFWLAFLLVMLFSVKLNWLPAMGYGGWQHVILPAFSVALASLAVNARLLRASILEISGQRHVVWARLRGLTPRYIERHHILLNALPPLVTVSGMHIGELLGGTLLIETIFAWPGVGRYAVSAIMNRDYPVIQCVTLLMVTIFMLCNLGGDLLHFWLDPRLRRHEERAV